ncbi:uncharacterized protein LOC131935122 [Physella acuta]|uniref:uncharacterized protein LOC131935122 n=1 Tax=Physella acuta TaxID=109671 RepID=UPI0027DE5E20|nr:uncharacterized protein LOC131935122 [Physella acuta]XP_059147452.1 uncharacterized protein LOC131935122 [Physella acuta]XP_059147463.1 uncharacterized protein LOC131935122 [Physella acuta]XP_059147467.1 uncharacterized protein LOC131935122 [Physella acuta]XP_059147476.1 uncharacterized protein LOC131935122 [Physella acuta]
MTDPGDCDTSNPGFFMKSTIQSLQMKFPSVKNISTAILAKWLKTPNERTVVILDARAQEEFDVSHLDGALRVDYKDKDIEPLAQKCSEKLKDKQNPTIVSYCSLGYRSSVVVQKLQDYYKESEKQPVPEIYNLSGSIFKWANERRPLVDNAGNPTKYVHPYTAFWSKLLDSSLWKTEP